MTTPVIPASARDDAPTGAPPDVSPSRTSTDAPQRNLAVDLLRTLSIALVMLAHGALPPDLIRWLPQRLVDAILHNGYYGVSIFFVISGFLITSTTIRHFGSVGGIDPRFFYVMRVGRIVPGLALSLLAIYIGFRLKLPGFVPPDPGQIARGIYAAATLQYHVFFPVAGGGPGMDPLSIFWSLSIEEVFYLIFPILGVLCVSRRLWVGVLLAVVVNGMLYRQDPMRVFAWWGAADLLSIGCLTAVLASRFPPRRLTPDATPDATPHAALRAMFRAALYAGLPRLAGVVGIGAVLLCLPWQTHFRFGPTAMGLCAALFLLGSAPGGAGRARGRGPVNGLLRLLAKPGAWSYELYITHIIVRYVVDDVLGHPQPTWRTDLVLLVAVFGTASLVAHFYTEPMNRAIRAFYRRSLPPVVHAQRRTPGGASMAMPPIPAGADAGYHRIDSRK